MKSDGCLRFEISSALAFIPCRRDRKTHSNPPDHRSFANARKHGVIKRFKYAREKLCRGDASFWDTHAANTFGRAAPAIGLARRRGRPAGAGLRLRTATTPVFPKRRSAEPKGSVSRYQGFREWIGQKKSSIGDIFDLRWFSAKWRRQKRGFR